METKFLLFGFIISPWHLYLSLGLLLVVAEIFIPGFVLLPIGIAFGITSIVALFVNSITLHLLSLAISLFVVFFAFRRLVHKNKQQKGLATNVDHMVGKEAIVEEEINSEANSGYVKLYGDSWKAVALYEDRISVGTRVIIEKVDGNKVLVRKRS